MLAALALFVAANAALGWTASAGLAWTASAAAAVCGDADGDGTVGASDGVRILRVAAELESACPSTCDVDGDGGITVADGVLALRRAADLAIVDRCGPGSIAGRLLVLPAAPLERREEEPNDGPGTATVAGPIALGMPHRLRGTIDPDDAFDGWTLVAPTSVTLDLTLAFDDASHLDLDLLVDDRRGAAASCEDTAHGRERCTVTVGTRMPQPFDVVVAFAAGARAVSYTLTVVATPGAAAEGLVTGPGAGPPRAVDAAVYRGDAAEIVAGEVLVRTTRAAGERRSDARAATAAALASELAAAGVPEGFAVETEAPDGTMLLALPDLIAAAAGDDPDATDAVKHARAAARARTYAAAAALAAAPGVAAAAPHRVVRAARVPRDPLFARQWPLAVMDLPRAWDVTIGGASTIVAVVDTGIRSDHPDFAGRLVPGFDFIANPRRANDGDGIDPDPFDPGDRPSAAERGTFHGSHVAGTIGAATDNPAGIAGASWRGGVMPLRVLGVGGGTIFDVAQAVRYAAGLPNVSGRVPATPARIINLSLTTTGDDPFLRSAVDAAVTAGVLVVAAAGNTGRDGFVSPAGFANVVAVAATDRLGTPARYSSFGASIDLAAPGGDTRRDRDDDGVPDGVLSTLLPGERDYASMQGTSMASAHVSGVAALLLGLPGGASAARLRDTLLATADDRGAPGRDDRHGAGLLDAAEAVRALAGLPDPSEPVLVADTSALRLAANESSARVRLRNGGGGTLVLHAPEVAADAGGPWLTARIEDADLRVEANREPLAPGDARGRITIRSNGGDVEIAVVAEVPSAPPEDIGAALVHLRDAATRTLVATTTTDAARAYRYDFAGVAPGRYQIVAGTDRDGDGMPCEVGDLCGAYPERSAPDPVEVLGGAGVRARDFGLSLVVSASDPPP